MKKCEYCGRDNCDEAGHCRECGTPFTDPSADVKPAQPRDRTSLKRLGCALRYASMIALIGLFYLLSFGPVERYCGTVTSRSLTRTTVSVDGHTMVQTAEVTVRYPRWVGIVYHPAFVLRSGSGGNGLYARYCLWWEVPLPLHPRG